MENRIKGLILSILILALALTTAFFFSLSQAKIDLLFTPNVIPLLKVLLSTNFMFFLLSGSVTIALILITIRMLETKEAILFSCAGYLLGGILGCVIFGMMEYLLAVAFGMIGVILAAKMLNEKEQELKYMQTIRSGAFASGKIITLFAVGFLIFMLIIAYPNQKVYEDKFTEEILNFTIGNTQTLKEQITSPLTDLIIKTQKTTILGIKSAPTYTALQTTSDPEDLAFVMTMNAIEQEIDKKEYETLVKSQLQQSTAQLDFGKEILKDIPFVSLTAKNAWLIYCVSGFILILIMGNLIIKNISTILYWVLVKIIPKKQNNEE
jgi:hypothetical protein